MKKLLLTIAIIFSLHTIINAQAFLGQPLDTVKAYFNAEPRVSLKTDHGTYYYFDEPSDTAFSHNYLFPNGRTDSIVVYMLICNDLNRMGEWIDYYDANMHSNGKQSWFKILDDYILYHFLEIKEEEWMIIMGLKPKSQEVINN